MKVERRERVIVRFAGDSGDGMQLAGGRFTDATAVFGNDLATLPSFPAEIRAPAGSLAGVSSFQIHFAERDIATPGDTPNVLVAMNPAALRSNLAQLERGATIIVNEDAFTTRNLQKAAYESSPLEDDSLDGFQVKRVPMTTLVGRAVEALEGATTRDAQRARNLFALGLVSWLYDRPTEVTERWIEGKFADKPTVRDVNLAAFRAGCNFGETSELIDVRYEVRPATDVPPGVYRNVNGTTTTALGLLAASVRSGLPLVLSAYPITPASDLLHDLSNRQSAGVRTIQAEDEIAAAGMALGAAFGGALGVTATSGPGLDLKTETIGLAVALELPMVIVDVQRAGPSTGMPTKTEQSDLLAALYGRHGESPVPIVAASTPGQCFDAAYEAVRIAVRYRTPVILLTDLFLANGSEPWRIPQAASLPAIDPAFAQEPSNGAAFMPYARNDDGARPWAIPGTPGLTHRIGGLEKQDVTGEISYDPANHARMTALRAAKVAGIDVPDVEVDHEDGAELLVIGWGSSEGARARRRAPRAPGRAQGRPRPPASPQPAARQPRRGAARLPARPAARDEQRPAHRACCAPSTSSTSRATRASRGARCSRPRSRTPSWRCCRDHRTPAAPDQGGLPVRPGDALVPGLRRLLGARRHPGLHARARHPAREDRLRDRHRLRRALRLLHGHLRDARHPRPRPDHRHRPGGRARRPLGVDRQRRRRCAVDRRQPPRARAAPQRPGQDPALQQPHLRADQGPGLADERVRQGDQVDAGRLDRSAARRAVAGPRRRRHLRRAHRRPRQAGARRGPARGGRAPRHRLRRGPPGLPGLQRRRLRPPHPEGRRGRQPHQPRRRPADPLRPRPRARASSATTTARWASPASTRSAPTA